MKSFIYLAMGILCFALYSFTNSTAVPDTPLKLEEAIKKGIIKLSVTGLGGHSGNCISAKIKNTSTQNISLKIAPGTLFKPDDTTMQDILIVKELLVNLEKNSEKSQPLTGFCCISENRCPSEGMNFKLGKVSNPKLIEIAVYLNKSKHDENTMQSAVWSVSDANSVSEIYDEEPEKVRPLREEVCRLTGQTNDWYSTNTNRVVDERGYIQTEPVKIAGDISVEVKNPAPIYQGVYRENGEEVIANKKVFDISRTGMLTYKFAMQVKGWKKGNYYVKVTMSGKEILKQKFTI